MAYQRPMVTVDQNMTITPTSIERDQPAFIFGPNYELHRYDDPDEKAGTKIGTFDGISGSPMYSPYPGVIDYEKVDKGYTKLFGDNVMVELADLGKASLPERNASKAIRDVNGGYTKLLFDDKVYLDNDPDSSSVKLAPGLLKNLAKGNTLLVAYKETGGAGAPLVYLKTSIKEVVYEASSFDIGSSDSAPEGGDGTLVTIEDALPETVDVDSVEVRLVAIAQGVEFEREDVVGSSEAETGLYQWEQSDYGTNVGPFTYTEDGQEVKVHGVKINNLYALVYSSYLDQPQMCKVLFADLFVQYRELITSYSDTLHSLVGASEVANQLGVIDPDNPLAMGVYMAALNSTTDDGDEAPPVYFMAVPSDDSDGYAAVLNKATLTDRVYVLAPTTRNEDVLDMVKSHVLDMSTKTVKRWRIAAASAEIPETVNKLDRLLDPQGDDFLAIPVCDNGIAVGSNDDAAPFNRLRVVKSATDTNGNTNTQFFSTLVPGDKVRFGYYTDLWGNVQFDTYTIKSIVNNYTVEIETDTSKGGKPINVDNLEKAAGDAYWKPAKIEIYHVYTSAETAELVASISKAMATRRMINVFPSIVQNNGVTMTGEFAACAVAGLVSATEPQQPITNVTVRGIDNIPMVYQQFNSTQLDIIASGGTFIVAQDLPNDRVYVRHQITTAYADGNLNTAELSITKNVDSISYAFAEVYRPYYGKYNITPDLIAVFRNLAGQLISQFGGTDSVYGPQLIVEETAVRYVRQNELMKDHADIGITLGVPYPCNNIDIVLTV